MIRRMLLAAAAMVLLGGLASSASAQERAYSRVWGGQYGRTDWERFYHYPYVWYPQNFWGNEYYRSSEDLYFRYPPEMRVPGVQQAVAQLRIPKAGGITRGTSSSWMCSRRAVLAPSSFRRGPGRTLNGGELRLWTTSIS